MSRARRDRRRTGLALTALAVAVLGLVLHRLAPTHPAEPLPAAAPADAVRQGFDDAVALLRARHFGQAELRLRQVIELAPRLPEARVNLGFALLGLDRAAEARAAFDAATELAPAQANAYYGLALAHESLGEMAAAIGAMRSYLHLARDEREEHLRRARAALWEWEARRAAPARP